MNPKPCPISMKFAERIPKSLSYMLKISWRSVKYLLSYSFTKSKVGGAFFSALYGIRSNSSTLSMNKT